MVEPQRNFGLMKSKPKVLRIINRFNLGGPTYNAAYLTKYLEDDFETLLIGGQKMESEESSLHITDALQLTPEIIPEMSRAFSPMNDLNALRKISKIIQSFKPDIVHTHASKSGALGRIAAKLNHVDVVVHTFHGHVFENYFGPFKSNAIMQSERLFAKMSTRIVAISNKQKQDLVNKFHIANASKFEIIPLGFDLRRFTENNAEKRSAFRSKYNLNSDDVAVGIIGRLVPIKDHQLFINAMALLKKKNISFKAFIIGDGELKERLQSSLADLGLNNEENNPNIIFTSWIHEVDKAIAGLDIIALSSLSEGTPVSLIEAQAGSKPVVSTHVGGVEDIIIENETGFLSPASDELAFSINLEKLILNDKLRREMGEKGKKFSHENFGVNRLVSDMKKLYIDLLNQ